MDLSGLVARGAYIAASVTGRTGKTVLDRYFVRFPDVYSMEKNGDGRFLAMAEAIGRHVGKVDSLLDASCHEGYGIALIARRLGATRIEGLDVSDVAIARARVRLADFDATLRQFDLRELYRYPERTLPAARADVVIVSEVLYYLGLRWRFAALHVQEKLRMVEALKAAAGKAVLFQHFGRDVRKPIDSVLTQCGARLVDEQWGIYVLATA